jgi:hypothetical protein
MPGLFELMTQRGGMPQAEHARNVSLPVSPMRPPWDSGFGGLQNMTDVQLRQRYMQMLQQLQDNSTRNMPGFAYSRVNGRQS